jgi:hypothetical protein
MQHVPPVCQYLPTALHDVNPEDNDLKGENVCSAISFFTLKKLFYAWLGQPDVQFKD